MQYNLMVKQMKYINSYLKKHQKYLKFIFITLIIGFIMGLFFYHKTDNTLFNTELKNIANILENNHLNYFLFHLIVLSLILVASFSVIGLILIPLYLLYEGICLGYNFLSFFTIFHFKGLLFSLIYLLITKLLYLILIIILFSQTLSLIKYLINLLKAKSPSYNLHHHLKIIIISILSIFLNDLFIYLFAHKILSYISHFL